MFSWFCGGGREEGRWSFCSKNFPQSAVDRVRAGGERGAAGSEQEALRRGRSLSLNGPGGPRAAPPAPGRGAGEAPAGALARMHLPLPCKGRPGEGGRVPVAQERAPHYQGKKSKKK